ncbi:MAG: ATP-binding protein [Candidatus Levyibacteriota bacterium]
MVTQSTDVIVLIDGQGKVSYASDSLEKVLGFKPSEIKKKRSAFLLHPKDREQYMQAYTHLFEKQGNQTLLQCRIQHKNGKWVWIEATGVNLLNSPINAIVATFRGINGRKLLEEQKEEFMGIISHELKTPVTSLKAYAQVLQSRFAKKGDEPSAVMLIKMINQVDRLEELIGDLLDMAQIEGGKLRLHENFFYFDELVNEVVEELQRVTEKHIILREGVTRKTICGDRERMGQVLRNLLSNAIKYSPRKKRVIISSFATKKYITVSVQDFGIGIAKEKQGRIFERFFRERGEREETFPGIGLGLYIASEIIKQQGGTIWVDSEKGKGSTFFFTIPL